MVGSVATDGPSDDNAYWHLSILPSAGRPGLWCVRSVKVRIIWNNGFRLVILVSGCLRASQTATTQIAKPLWANEYEYVLTMFAESFIADFVFMNKILYAFMNKE